MLKKPKTKTITRGIKTIGAIFLVTLVFGGYFTAAKPVQAVECTDLRKGSYISSFSFETNKQAGEDNLVGPNEPLTLYFKGTIPNNPTASPGDKDAPNWLNCLQTTSYKVYFNSFIYRSNFRDQVQNAGNVVSVNLKIEPLNGDPKTLTATAGVDTTLAKMLPKIGDYGPQSTLTYYVVLRAYVCGNNDCVNTDLLGLSNFGEKTFGIGGPNDTGNANPDAAVIAAMNADRGSFDPNPTYQTALAANIQNATGENSTAGGVLNAIATLVSAFILGITTLVYWLFAFVVAPLIEALLSIHPYKDVFVQVIYPGWLILRNLSNILFIIVLLVIGLGTLFQVEQYNYKHLLVKVVISAVLVNFSLVIGQSVLGLADTVQNQFLPERLNVVRALGFELMVKPVQQMHLVPSNSSAAGGLSNITQPFFLMALALGAFFGFLAILVFLVVRIVALWILLMIAPLAYVARILPETEKYAEEWWKKFLTYAFLTPIFAFFLNIAALFATSHVFSQGSPIFNLSSVTGNIAEFVYLTAGHVTVLAFLLAGLTFAGSTGAVGAAAMTSLAQKGMKLPALPFLAGGKYGGKAAAGLAKAGGERLLEEASIRSNAQLDPRKWIEGWKEYSKEKKHERLSKLESSGGVFSKPQNALESYANWHGIKRVFKVGFKGRATEVLAKLKDAQAKKDAAEHLLTDEDGPNGEPSERRQKMLERDALNEEFNDLPRGMITKDRAAKEVSTAIADQINEYQERIGQLGGKDGEIAKATTAGKVEQTNQLNLEKGMLEAYVKDLQAVNKNIESQVLDPSQNKVDMNVAKAGLSSIGSKKAFDEVFNVKEVEEQIRASIRKINKDLQEDANARVKLNVTTTLDKAGVEKWQQDTKKAVKTFEKTLSEVKRPEFYHARLARVAAENAEMKKIVDIDDAEELKRYLDDAIHEGNTARVGAIIKKLSMDNNFNELLEGKALDGSDILSNADGTKKYFEKIAKKTGMTKSHMMQLASEVSYINEGQGGYAYARTTKSTPGGLEWNDGNNWHDQEQAAFAEASKKNYRSQAQFPRWNFVVQKRDEKTGGWITVRNNNIGMGLLKQAGANADAFKNEYGRNFRPNNAAAILQPSNWETQLAKLGMSKNVRKMLRDVAASNSGELYVGDFKISGGPQMD